jgi:ABC-type glutathione transport system ATPase component
MVLNDWSLSFENVSVLAQDGRPLLRDVQMRVDGGEAIAVVGESGSGKSTLLRTILGLVDSRLRCSGRIGWQGIDLLTLRGAQLERIRGREIGIILQSATAALNPLLTIERQIGQVLALARTRLSRAERHSAAVAALARLGLDDPARRARQYPHQFSGGMRQRAMIAIATANRPRLLLADEPTSALDPTVKKQVLTTLGDLRQQTGMGLVLVTHDLLGLETLVDRIAVLKDGELVEQGAAVDVLGNPRHPYTQQLVAAATLGALSKCS